MSIPPEREIEIEQSQAVAQMEGGPKASFDAAALVACRSKRALRAGAADLLRNGP